MIRRSPAAAAQLALCSALMISLQLGCSQIETDDHFDRGQADEVLTAEECAALNPETDEQGFCRAASGRFAPAQCCADSAVCSAAVLEDDGSCRRADNGRFAPASCCAAKCDSAKLDLHGFCRAASGQFAPSACCADQCFLAQAPAGSCSAAACGDASEDDDCFCDDICTENGDCCADKAEVCGGNGNTPTPIELPKGECTADICGSSTEDGSCFCDDDCTAFGDCCINKPKVCGGIGLDLEVSDCGPDDCEGVTIVDGVCRTANGRFAKSTCCAELPVCAAARVDDQGVCRREDNGQFAPSLCCKDICRDSRVDAAGLCRNSDGQFAQAGCCADQCFEAQDRPARDRDVSSLDACNGKQE